MVKKSSFQIIAFVLAAFFFFCLIICFMKVFFFNAPNIILVCLMPIGIIGLITYCIVYRKEFIKDFKSVIAVFFCVLCITFCFITRGQKPFDLMRYHLYQNAYHQAAQQIAQELKETPEDNYNAIGDQYKADERIPEMIRKDGISYIKFGDNIIINFKTSVSFSYESGFMYYEGPDALDFLEHPGQYQDGLTDDKIYEVYALLEDPHWAYIEWVW